MKTLRHILIRLAAGFPRTAAGSLVALALMLTASCSHRPLEEYSSDGTKISIRLDTLIPNVTCDIYNKNIPVKDIEPDVMRVLFFHEKEDKLLSDVFIQQKVVGPTGEVRLEGNTSIWPGEYRMIAYSFGAVTTYVANYDSYVNSYAYCDPLPDSFQQILGGARAEKPEQPVMEQPDHIFVGRDSKVHLPYHGGEHVIKGEAGSLVESYYIQIYVDGIQFVSSVSAVLTSMSSSANFSTGEKDITKPTALYFPLLASEDDGKPVVCTVFNTFGRIPESQNELKVSFSVTRTDGKVFGYTFDISDLFLTEECIDHHWLLLDEVLNIPAPEISGDGGYHPSIVDWEEIESEIII